MVLLLCLRCNSTPERSFWRAISRASSEADSDDTAEGAPEIALAVGLPALAETLWRIESVWDRMVVSPQASRAMGLQSRSASDALCGCVSRSARERSFRCAAAAVTFPSSTRLCSTACSPVKFGMQQVTKWITLQLSGTATAGT